MLVDWPKCGSDPQDEGHMASLQSRQSYWDVFVPHASQGRFSLLNQLPPTIGFGSTPFKSHMVG